MQNLPVWFSQKLAECIDSYLPWPVLFLLADNAKVQIINAQTGQVYGVAVPCDTLDQAQVTIFMSNGDVFSFFYFSEKIGKHSICERLKDFR